MSHFEAAVVLRVAPRKVRQLCRDGVLPAAKPGRVWLILPSVLDRYLRGELPSQQPAVDPWGRAPGSVRATRRAS